MKNMTNKKFQPELPDLSDFQPDPGRFADIQNTPFGQDLIRFVKAPDNLVRMVTAVDFGRVSAEALQRGLLDTFGDEVRPDRVKQYIGYLVRKCLERCGFHLDQTGVKIHEKLLFTSRGCRYKRNRDGEAYDQTSDAGVEG